MASVFSSSNMILMACIAAASAPTCILVAVFNERRYQYDLLIKVRHLSNANVLLAHIEQSHYQSFATIFISKPYQSPENKAGGKLYN